MRFRIWRVARKGHTPNLRPRPQPRPRHGTARHNILCSAPTHQRHGRPERGPLSREECVASSSPSFFDPDTLAVGWSSSQTRNAAFQQPYDPTGYGSPPQDIGVKARIVDLISAVRTLMRSAFSSLLHELLQVLTDIT